MDSARVLSVYSEIEEKDTNVKLWEIIPEGNGLDY